MSFIPFLMGAMDGGAAASNSQTGSLASTFIMFGLIFAVMYFMVLRPQSKKQKETQRMIDALKKGDKVVTIGGIHGVVSSTKEKTVVVKVDDNTKIEFSRTAIASVVVDKPASDKAAGAAKEEKKGLFGFGKKSDKPDAEKSDTTIEEKDSIKNDDADASKENQ